MAFTRAISLISVALIASVPMAGCGLKGAAEPAKEDIVIAADLELSGAAAAVGTAYDRALRLKIDQLNASGVLGGRKIRYEVKDNRSDKTLSLANITDFTNDTSVDGLITGACSECVQAASKTINAKRMVTVSLSPANNATKVGLLTTDDTYGKDGLSAMRTELDPGGSIQITATEQFKPTDTDVSQPTREVVDAKPDALVVWAFAEQAQRVAADARGAGYQGPIYFDAAAAGDLFLLGSTPTETDNTTMIFTQTLAIDDVIATTPAKAARKQWFRDYTSRYGTYYGPASFAADAVQLLVNAMDQADGTDPDTVRNALETTQMDGLSGPIRITPANHSGLMAQALVVLVANSGRWRLKV